ncbi:Uncharacterised protein [Mycobacteroides abscessus subsp. massiliense]|nr:Uncharacterised protein [Mycobacteroides abscessus subsp. massiliense]
MFDAADGLVEMELYAFFQTELVQVLGEEVAVAGRIRRQVQAAGNFGGNARQRRLEFCAFFGFQTTVGHAVSFQNANVLFCRFDFFGLAENLQSAFFASFKIHAGLRFKTAEHLTAVFGNPDHALFVGLIAGSIAVLQHLPQPFDLIQAAVRAKQQRRMAFKQPFQRFGRDTGCSPRRGIAVRELSGIGKTGFHRHALGAVDDRYFMSCLCQIPRGRYAGNTST